MFLSWQVAGFFFCLFFSRFQGFLNKAKEEKKELPDPFLSSPLEKTAEHRKSSRNCEMHMHYLRCFLVSYRMFDTGSASVGVLFV